MTADRDLQQGVLDALGFEPGVEEVQVEGAARRDDGAIAQAAANTVAWDSAVPSHSVRVAVHDGWITLSGQVEWRFQRDAAEQPLHRLCGVRGITNLIAVDPR